MKKWKRTFRGIALGLAALVAALGFGACGAGEGNQNTTLTLAKASEINWKNADGVVVYTEDNLASPFFSDQNDIVTYFCNAMYRSYGYLTPANQPFVGTGVGWAPAWYKWMALTRNWSDNTWAKETWRNYVINVPVSEDGYIWSYDTPHWPDLGFVDSHHNYHYDNNFNYIIAAANYIAWENSLALLDERDRNTVGDTTENNEGTYHKAEDVSEGMTVREKLALAVSYVMEELHGKDGLIIIDENVNDGLNLGLNDHYASNYWDNIPFGYKDAYENILFYEMLDSLAELEAMRGDAEKASSYRTLAGKVKEKFNETFWNESTGRYAGTVDVNGVMRDYGLTFVNTEAVACGLATEDRAKSIYDWLDGKRTVEGDTSQKEDIYRYLVAPRSNTLDFGAVSDPSSENKYWWHDNNGGQSLSGNGSYGYHLENGGAIMYTEYYDLMGRIASGNLSSALDRMILLAKEYAKDELARDPMNPVSGGSDVLGIIGEFPESGLVPTAFLYGFMGVDVGAGGLSVSPAIPEPYRYLGVKNLIYGGNDYTLTVYANGKVKLEGSSRVDLLLTVKDYRNKGRATVSLYDENDNIIRSFSVSAEEGVFSVDLRNAAQAPAFAVVS